MNRRPRTGRPAGNRARQKLVGLVSDVAGPSGRTQSRHQPGRIAWRAARHGSTRQSVTGNITGARDHVQLAVSAGLVIVSGLFVITHVILQKQESYWPYITRTIFSNFSIVRRDVRDRLLHQWPAGGSAQQPRRLRLHAKCERYRVEKAHLPMHALAHLFMMHGAVPNDVLPHSEYAFNMPAWSISLEWQFYLVAPLFIFVLLKQPDGLSRWRSSPQLQR